MEEKKNLMEEWEDDELTAEQEDQKANKGLFKKRALKEKKAKKEKTPTDPGAEEKAPEAHHHRRRGSRGIGSDDSAESPSRPQLSGGQRPGGDTLAE